MVCPNCGRRTFKRETVCPKCGTAMPERKYIEPVDTEPTDTEITKGESDLKNFFNRNSKKSGESAAEPAQPANVPRPEVETPAEPEIPVVPDMPSEPETPPVELPSEPAEEVPPSVFVPEIEFSPVQQPVSDPSDGGELHSDMVPEFYGSYGEAVNETEKSPTAGETSADETPAEPAASEIDFSVLDFDIPAAPTETAENTESADFSPMPDIGGDDDDLVLPDIPMPAPSVGSESKKSMGYETTVKLQNARSAYGNDKPINEPIKAGAAVSAPKRRDFTAVASGTAHVSGDLPKLKEGEMYVAVTPKELRRLKSRRFRGLGILATLCLVIISAFCIWSYANSFVDPLIGAWKGDVNSSYIPIEAIQSLDQDLIESTWEFSSSGSMYLNIVVNETPISLSGSYQQKKDGSGEPYLSMTLTNPMDSTDYTLEMYYTVTGDILEFTDMEGMGMTIDLTKE